MSVQFGRWNFEGQPPAPEYIEKVSAALAPYGPDSNESYSKGGVSILYRAFHTTKEGREEQQPLVTQLGTVIAWDGRLDNRAELTCQLNDSQAAESTDLAVVAGAYKQWDVDCFAKLKGDWALSVWNAVDRSLILAKDPIGVRHLYYSIEKDHVAWSTILEPLVRFGGKTAVLNEEYIAGWLSMFPAAHLTPYVGIHSVPPSSMVILQPERHVVSKYWDFDPTKKLRYRSDAEYEEHFLTVFEKAVRRRLRSDRPVLAELSGGRDSSSIVCMADTILTKGTAETPRLDTLSVYDDSEPNWNERPYFVKVEEKRGRKGWHINVARQALEANTEPKPGPAFFSDGFAPIPGYDRRISSQIGTCLSSNGNRVVLSGIGGDEVTGGVPTPTPELQDLLARAQLCALARQLKLWALEMKKPWFHLLLQAVRGFLPPERPDITNLMSPVCWLQQKFATSHRVALAGYPRRIELVGPLPTFQHNLATLEGLRRQLAHTPLPLGWPSEKRYPFLDLGLLEFMYAIPREQLVRPKQRRSLMRRALIGIVPDEILNRRSKAFIARSPLVGITEDWPKLAETTQHMVASSLGIVDPERLLAVLQKGRRGEVVPTIPLMRTIFVEDWLKRSHLLA